MTNITELFSGIGIVIDDVVNKHEEVPNSIQKIIASFEDKNIPLIKYDELPANESLIHFNSVSFLLLDWNLSDITPIPEVIIKDNIEFINGLKKYCFLPVFIFSDEEPNSIIEKLEEFNLYKKGDSNNIFVKRKSDLATSEQLFSEIESWLKDTPSIYVLKEWEKAKREAKIEMLWELSNAYSSWPCVLIKTIKEDGADVNNELIHLLQRSLSSRIVSPVFDITNKEQNPTKEELRRLLESERIVKKSLPDNPSTGDIYLDNGSYLLNIRPDCDIIRTKRDLYLLKGKIIDESTINNGELNCITFDSGNFIEKINSTYVAFIEGHIVEFKFRDIEIKKWIELRDKRIGKLLAPYITKIQQKYSFYLQRQGIPAIPIEAVK